MKALGEVLRGIEGLPAVAPPPAEPSAAERSPVADAPGLSILLQPRALILTGLPYRRNDAVRELTRTARVGARTWLRVTYLATDERFPLPFGSDRSLLAWITTKAITTGEVRFSAIADYFRAFGLDRGGRAYKTFRQRFQRIANLALRIEEFDDERRSVRKLFVIPRSVEPLELLCGAPEKLETKLLAYDRYGFQIDGDFWELLKETRVPTPTRVLRTFHREPRAWDFAQFLLYRTKAAKSEAVVPWKEIVAQLGMRDRDLYRVKADLERTLERLRAMVPDLQARFLPGLRGLEVLPRGERPAPPPIESPRTGRPRAGRSSESHAPRPAPQRSAPPPPPPEVPAGGGALSRSRERDGVRAEPPREEPVVRRPIHEPPPGTIPAPWGELLRELRAGIAEHAAAALNQPKPRGHPRRH